VEILGEGDLVLVEGDLGRGKSRSKLGEISAVSGLSGKRSGYGEIWLGGYLEGRSGYGKFW
jgi:hypothetical protein